MEVSAVTNSLGKHRMIRSIFINNGSFSNNRDLRSMSTSCVGGFGRIDTTYLLSQKQYNLVTICKLKKEIDVKLLPHRRLFNYRRGIPIPYRLSPRSCLLKPCQVQSDDSEGTISSENTILDEQKLERDLQIAIQEEDYAQAAKIRDNLKHLHEDSRAAVLAANSRFYDSFRKGDLATMQALWSKSENVCVVHPGVSGIKGYELVMGSWEFVWADYEFPLSIEVKDVQVKVRGNFGYVTCIEMVRTTGKNWGRQFATNVFEKIDGQWFICIHHASHVDL